jgi:hypothetical protein
MALEYSAPQAILDGSYLIELELYTTTSISNNA